MERRREIREGREVEVGRARVEEVKLGRYE
jgi:hypothetical protein